MGVVIQSVANSQARGKFTGRHAELGYIIAQLRRYQAATHRQTVSGIATTPRTAGVGILGIFETRILPVGAEIPIVGTPVVINFG